MEEMRKAAGFRPWVLDEKVPKDSILLVWALVASLRVWIFGHEEVKPSTLFCFALPLPSEEDLSIKLFLDAL